MTLYQLDRQAGLSDSTTAYNDELVFPQELHQRVSKQLLLDVRAACDSSYFCRHIVYIVLCAPAKFFDLLCRLKVYAVPDDADDIIDV